MQIQETLNFFNVLMFHLPNDSHVLTTSHSAVAANKCYGAPHLTQCQVPSPPARNPPGAISQPAVQPPSRPATVVIGTTEIRQMGT